MVGAEVDRGLQEASEEDDALSPSLASARSVLNG